MTPLPAALGGVGLVAWRIDTALHASTWDSGEGAYRAGGRWNSRGVRAVYCSLDPSTTVLEVAVHKTFRVLDAVPHVLSEIEVNDPSAVRVVHPHELPDPDWLRPGIPNPRQQAFGDQLLASHRFVVIPSVVSRRSWNLVFERGTAAGRFALRSQEPFELDGRLHARAS